LLLCIGFNGNIVYSISWLVGSWCSYIWNVGRRSKYFWISLSVWTDEIYKIFWGHTDLTSYVL